MLAAPQRARIYICASLSARDGLRHGAGGSESRRADHHTSIFISDDERSQRTRGVRSRNRDIHRGHNHGCAHTDHAPARADARRAGSLSHQQRGHVPICDSHELRRPRCGGVVQCGQRRFLDGSRGVALHN